MTFLRLDPAHPALWRDETTLQLGAHAVVTVSDPAPWQQRVLDAMERGVESTTLERLTTALDVPGGELDAFLALLATALARPDAPRTVRLRAADGVDATTCTDVAEALGAVGISAAWTASHLPSDGEPVVLLAHHHVPPHVPAGLMADDVPHVPVVFDGAGVTVGPVVVPGRTACLACLSAHERDRDPAWPAIAAQLVGRRPAPVPRARAMEAGMLVARLLREAIPQVAGTRPADPGPLTATTSVRSSADARRAWRSHRPHPRCLCGAAPTAPERGAAGEVRSRPGSGTAAAPPAPVSAHPASAPTRSTGFARPA
jgi:hypothetical protein